MIPEHNTNPLPGQLFDGYCFKLYNALLIALSTSFLVVFDLMFFDVDNSPVNFSTASHMALLPDKYNVIRLVLPQADLAELNNDNDCCNCIYYVLS